MLATTGSIEIETAEGMAGLIQAREMRGCEERLVQLIIMSPIVWQSLFILSEGLIRILIKHKCRNHEGG